MAGINTLVDSVSAANLISTFPGAFGVSVSGKIGTAIQLGVQNEQWKTTSSSHWIFAHSFSIRFWIKPKYAAGNYDILGNDQFDIWLMADMFVGGQMTISAVIDTNPGDASIDSTKPLTLNDWNRVIIWFEEGVGSGVKINDETPETFATVNPMQTYAAKQLILTGSHFMDANAIDEIAIWKRKLTDAEMTYDWNLGNGRTYPDLP